MANEIRCSNCQSWNVIPTDKTAIACKTCGKEIENELTSRKKLLQDNRQKQLDEWIFKINEGDSFLLRFLKSVGNVIYLIFMSIATFIAWLVAALPG